MNADTNSNGQSFDLDYDANQTVEWVERECDRCGEQYAELKMLAEWSDRATCPDCADPPRLFEHNHAVGLDLSNFPLLEYGPLSHDAPDR